MWKVEAKGHSGAACESNGIVTIGTGKRFVYEEPLGTCDPYELVVKKSCAQCTLCAVCGTVCPPLARVIGNMNRLVGFILLC